MHTCISVTRSRGHWQVDSLQGEEISAVKKSVNGVADFPGYYIIDIYIFICYINLYRELGINGREITCVGSYVL